MRDPSRIKRIINKLQALWEAYPDLRFNQLIAAVTPPGVDTFYLEDDAFEKMLDEQAEKNIAIDKP